MGRMFWTVSSNYMSVEFPWSSHPGLLLVDPSMTRSHLHCARRPAGAHLSTDVAVESWH
jgi:hypothetical protein